MKPTWGDGLSVLLTNTLLGVVGMLDKVIDLAIAGLFTIGVQVSIKYLERRFFSKK